MAQNLLENRDLIFLNQYPASELLNVLKYRLSVCPSRETVKEINSPTIIIYFHLFSFQFLVIFSGYFVLITLLQPNF